MRSSSILAAAVLVAGANAQGAAYAQCGGQGFSGATTCVSGYVCTTSNDYYSQCLPGQAPAPDPVPAPSPTDVVPDPTPISTPSAPVATTPSVPATAPGTVPAPSTPAGPAGTGPGTTLQPGWLWIRAVEAPNFHKYLQTKPEYSTGKAIMDSYTTAGQFNIINGQLVEKVGGGMLYANVAPRVGTGLLLAVTFEKTPNTYGKFAFSGDAVTWTIAGFTRPNNVAWYVCTGQQLFINLGAYLYGTPAGCADETIHYYNGATAVP